MGIGGRQVREREKKIIQKERLNLKGLGHEIDLNFLTEMNIYRSN